MLMTYSTKEQSEYRKLQGALLGEFGLIADPDDPDFDALLRPDEALANNLRNEGIRHERADLQRLKEGAQILVRKRDDGKYAVTLQVHAEKVSTDGKGKETEEPVDVMVDIGVFARPPGGKEADEKALYLRKYRITAADTTLELVVDALPYEAGIDPYNKLIDRDSGDNRKKATLLQ